MLPVTVWAFHVIVESGFVGTLLAMLSLHVFICRSLYILAFTALQGVNNRASC